MSLILDLIFPRTCYGCGKTGQYFCPDCLNRQKSSCIKLPNNGLDGCLSIFKYQSIIQQAIIDLKYNFISDICDELAYISSLRLKTDFPNLLAFWQKQNYTLVPIPLHPFRLNWRGFNQADLLGRKIASLLNLNFSPDLLFRSIDTLPQAKFKDKKQRLHNLSNAFLVEAKKPLPPNIILFDDVSTTFSTLKSALNALNSPLHSWGLTLAG